MSKPKPTPKPKTEDAQTAAEDSAPAAPQPKPSAMKFPPGVAPQGPRGPQIRRGWEPGGGGKPQKDFARRAGKSRKVH